MFRMLSFVAALAVASPALAQDDAILAEGRERSEAFLAGQLDGLWDDMTPDMQAALGSLEGFIAFRDGLDGELGEEDAIIDETTQTAPGADIYIRTSD